jgi:hypothetical protein
VGNQSDKKEFRNPCIAQLAFADAQNFGVHRLHANLEYARLLAVALVFREVL